jgi:aryl-alcohol dehydrogenase-like predicted oxidoreductase
MNYVTLGGTGWSVSAAPLGAMYLGTKQDESQSFALLDHYVAKGGNFIDTANIYAHWVGPQWRGGESESLIGRWLKARGHRDRMIITSKVGIGYGDVPQSLAPARIIAECDKSLRRLGVDTIDVYFAHKDDPAVPLEDVLGAFARLIEQGKIRAIGASNFTTDRLAGALELARFAGLPRYQVLQQRFTYLPVRPGGDTGRQIVLSGDMADLCRRAGLTVMAYSVALQGGYNRYPERALPAEYQMPSNVVRMARLLDVAREVGVDPQQVVLAWLWSKPGLVPLIACSTTAQLDASLAAMDLSLSAEQIERLDRAAE